MLGIAQEYYDQISSKAMHTWYDPKYMYYSGGPGDYIPELPMDNYSSHSFVSLNNDNEVIGYISYEIKWDTMSVDDLSVICFSDNATEGNIFVKDVLKIINDIFYKHSINRIEFWCYEDNPAIYDYGRSDATQAQVQKTSDLLAKDYRQIKDLEPGSKVIPEGYIKKKNGTATSNDLLLGKVAYSNGKELTGTVKEINKISIYKDSYSDISLVTEQQTGGSKTFLKIKSTPQLGNDGDHVMITSGQYKEELNIPIDVLAQFLGVRPEIIKYNEVILGVRGTYKGETT